MSETTEQSATANDSGAFGAQDDGDGFDSFLDDDSLMVSQLADADESLMAMDGSNYLERDDFDRELGSPSEDPFSEDFSSVSKLNIVDVVGDDRAGRPLVLVFAYRLPNNKTFDHDKLLRYLMHVLDKLVEQDYTLVYFHYGLRSHNKPPIKWLVTAYKLLDRRYKKNLKAMYLVHPTKFIRLVWNLFKPFISSKFEQKLHYVNYVHELKGAMHMDQLLLPQVIQEHDNQLMEAAKGNVPVSGSTSALDQFTPAQQFGVSLQ